MTALPEMTGFSRAGSAPSPRAEVELYQVDETYWGYTIRSNEPTPSSVILLQIVCWVVGIAFVVATFGLWILPSTITHGPALGMKLGATVVTASIAAFCLWFASRGTRSEIQIDTRLGEVREVVRNRAGKASLVGRYGFDAIGGVFIDRSAANGNLSRSHLVLRYRNTPQTLHVATGGALGLAPLRDRLGRDLMVSARPSPRAIPARAA